MQREENRVCSNEGVTVNSHRLCSFFWDALNSPNHLPYPPHPPLPHPTPVLGLLFLLIAGSFKNNPWWSAGLPANFTRTLLISVSSDFLKPGMPSHLKTSFFSSIASLLLPFPPLEVISPHQVGLLSSQCVPRTRDCSRLLPKGHILLLIQLIFFVFL